jgi:hypothetical protein
LKKGEAWMPLPRTPRILSFLNNEVNLKAFKSNKSILTYIICRIYTF